MLRKIFESINRMKIVAEKVLNLIYIKIVIKPLDFCRIP